MDRITHCCLDFTRDHIEALIMHLPMAEGMGWAYRGTWPRLTATRLRSDHGDGSVVPPCRVLDPLPRIVRCLRSPLCQDRWSSWRSRTVRSGRQRTCGLR
jgi:hypothetical protein